MAHYLSDMGSGGSGLGLVLPVSPLLDDLPGCACGVVVYAPPVRRRSTLQPSARPHRLRGRPTRSLMHLYKN